MTKTMFGSFICGVLAVLLAMFLFVTMTGCIQYVPGEAKVVRSTTLGLKARLASEAVDVTPILIVGWNEVEYVHALRTEVEVTAEHTDINLWQASGSVKRTLRVGVEDELRGTPGSTEEGDAVEDRGD